MIVNSKQSAKECYIEILSEFEKSKFLDVSIKKMTRLKIQNRWIQQCYTLVAAQQGNVRQDLVNHCKLNYGMSILVRDNEKKRALWRKIIKGLDEQERLDVMVDYPVTSLFDVDQCSEYIKELIAVYISDFELPEKQWRDK